MSGLRGLTMHRAMLMLLTIIKLHIKVFFFEKSINLSNTRSVEGTYAGEKFTTKSVYGRYCWQSCLHQWCAKVTTISSFMLNIFGFWTFGRKSFRHRKTHFTCYFCTPLYHPSSGKQNVLASASNKSPHFPHEFPVFGLRDFSLFKLDSFYDFFIPLFDKIDQKNFISN